MLCQDCVEMISRNMRPFVFPPYILIQFAVTMPNCSRSQRGFKDSTDLPISSNRYLERITEFLHHFKTMPCSNLDPHNSTTCLNFHPGERRRDPFVTHSFLYYCTGICSCENKDCKQSHSVYEHRFHPLAYKTTKCKNYDDCKNGLFCPELHSEDWTHLQGGQFFRFDIKLFKTQACYRQDPHDKKTCLYFHNDRDRRRPNFLTYSHMICSYRQNCKNIENCEWAHNKIEQLYHPSRYKSKYCENYPSQISKCKYGDFCSFAHTQDSIAIELIDSGNKDPNYIIKTYKTVWCPYTLNHERSNCSYAHNIQDFRRKPKDYKYLPEKCAFWNYGDDIKSIEEAGCKSGMKCNKCHGWMEYRYHPSVFGKINKKFNKRSFKWDKRDPYLNQTKIKEVTGQTDQTHQEQKSVFPVGVPFFKSEISNNSKKDEPRESDTDSFKTPNLNRNDDNFSLIMTEEEKIWTPMQTDDREQSRRSKSQRRSDEHSLHYSQSLREALAGEDELLKKLKQQKINYVNLINFTEEKIEQLQLRKNDKEKLKKRLLEYNLKISNQPIRYSIELMRYFIKHGCDSILQKMLLKRVKEKRLLGLCNKDIKDLNFLDETEKAKLPKILKQLNSDREFEEVNGEVKKYFTSKATG